MLYMDVVSRAGDIRDYWSRDPIWGDPHVRRVMSRDRFTAIRNNYTWMDTTGVSPAEREAKNKEDGFWTIAKLFDDLKKNYQFYYAPHRHMAVDEMCVFFKGRHRCRCYNPSKPNKWHFKIYALCDSCTGYLWNWDLYRGKDERREAGLSASEWPVWQLSEPEELHGRGHMFFHDNWFTSLPLALRMVQAPRGITTVGTIRTNRRHLPRAIVFPAKGAGVQERGTIKCKKINVDGHDIYFTAWMDTKPVHMISPFKPNFIFIKRMTKGADGQWHNINVAQPTCIPCYNQSMGAVDSHDQAAAAYDKRVRHQGRWQPRLYIRCLKSSIINALILYNDNSGRAVPIAPLTLLEFTKRIIEEWAGMNIEEEIEPELSEESDSEEDDEKEEPEPRRHLASWQHDVVRRTTGHHFPEIKESVRRQSNTYSNCRVGCIICEKAVSSKCQQCGVHLCLLKGNRPDCWAIFHSVPDLGARKRKRPRIIEASRKSARGEGK